VRRAFAALGLAVALLIVAAAPPARSGASFAAASKSPGQTLSADSVARYLSLYSQSTDPAGLTGYAVKSNSSPPVPAATGTNLGLALALGGWKNGGTMNRVLTLQAAATLPGGSITVAVTVPPVPQQPVSAATIAPVGSTVGTPAVVLTPGAKRQMNITIAKLPGNNLLYSGTIQLTVTYPGYTGSFFTYNVPFNVWDGNGGGP
jgi:hypothetical protein